MKSNDTPRTDQVFAQVWAENPPSDEVLHEATKLARKLERENILLREGLEKFRGQFDCYECTGTAEDILDSLENTESSSAGEDPQK